MNREIKEGNKLIAEFMGMKMSKEHHEEGVDFDWSNCPKNEHWPCESEPPFNESWDWLMPVVEKIFIDRRVVDFAIRPGKVKIKIKYVGEINSPHKPENDSITECFLAVVKFIRWHNRQILSKQEE